MKRVVVSELLDDDRGTRQQVNDSLADLRMLNRAFGGIATTVSLLRRVAQARHLRRLSLLDVAGATGDVVAGAHHALGDDGIDLEAVVIDQAPSHLAPGSRPPAMCGSAFQLPFRDQSFDVVGCSLFLHHLEPDEIRSFLAEAARVSRHAIIINDLRRSSFHWMAASFGSLIYRSAITRHDAPASVRRAYTSDELRLILTDAGYPSVEISHHFFYRLGIIVWREAVS